MGECEAMVPSDEGNDPKLAARPDTGIESTHGRTIESISIISGVVGSLFPGCRCPSRSVRSASANILMVALLAGIRLFYLTLGLVRRNGGQTFTPEEKCDLARRERERH